MEVVATVGAVTAFFAATIAIVQCPRPRRQIERWRDLDEGIRQTLLDILLPIWPDQQRPDRAWWRAWMAGCLAVIRM